MQMHELNYFFEKHVNVLHCTSLGDKQVKVCCQHYYLITTKVVCFFDDIYIYLKICFSYINFLELKTFKYFSVFCVRSIIFNKIKFSIKIRKM